MHRNKGRASVRKNSEMAAKRYEWATDNSRLGMKLLAKMGWKEGKGLGKEEDGLVKTIKPQRKGSEIGVGARTASENAWLTPGVLASDLNDVLARLAPVGDEIPISSTLKTQNATSESASKPKTCSRPPRGFYERRRARKNVNAYTPEELREIFGGVDCAPPKVPQVKAELTSSSSDQKSANPIFMNEKSESKATQECTQNDRDSSVESRDMSPNENITNTILSTVEVEVQSCEQKVFQGRSRKREDKICDARQIPISSHSRIAKNPKADKKRKRRAFAKTMIAVNQAK